ncbi:hypothetical protein QVZ41_13640 [Wenyingzhuangia sp. chi5]|uniref:Response regulatory domain-containing protein n=1 Tax=Wenyingzhuangia gilva TaxID=3057677 RepID=A0ABT8VV88_9FLAO|nr:hypothetical protein [Wenyingzhuangia sp. chi5]MDO3695888.1 hypothetical protein [Wenyingzhuangia sp. chi5]
MLTFEPNIVFIDDKEEQVNGIIKLYRNEGAGVKFFNADLVDGDPLPNTQYTNVNLVYLDLYYGNDFDIELCLGWIDSIISKNSFYILVIWSKDTHHAQEVIRELEKIEKKPFVTFVETKNEEYKNEDSSFKWNKLKEKINSELIAISEIEELSIWKKSILNSSNIVIGHLSKNTNTDALRKKLQKIIIGHGGTFLIGTDKENTKREVLFDALDNILTSNSKITRPNQAVSQVNKDELYNIPVFPVTDIDSKLNSWFHFKLIENSFQSNYITSGLISYFKNISLRKNYSILNDEGVLRFLSNQISVIENKPEMFDIAVIVSRPCDIAQNKFGKNLKLLSGVLVKKPVRDKKNKFKGASKEPLSLKLYDHLSFSDGETNCTLLFDFRYVFSLPQEIFEERFEKVKVFNKELISEIQVEYSAYSSRLGITQII